MRKTISVLMAIILTISLMPLVIGIDTGQGIGVSIETEDFDPLIWLCDSRIVYDDPIEWGRVSMSGQPLIERINNYAFEGESISWLVLVMDKNGIEKIEDVFATVAPDRSSVLELDDPTDYLEVNCQERLDLTAIQNNCNARIDEEQIITFDANTMRYYECRLTVETPGICTEPTDDPSIPPPDPNDPIEGDCTGGMYGENYVSVWVCDVDDIPFDGEGGCSHIDETEFWFFNPVIAIGVNGLLVFDNVRPGTSAYSDTVLISNEADFGSGVLLDMFITGTDFYDSDPSGAMCPTSNVLRLGDGDSACDTTLGPAGHQATTDPFCYYATSGAYSTAGDGRSDTESYVGIMYGDHFDRSLYGTTDPDFDGAEIIQDLFVGVGTPYFGANILAPGAEMALTFRLNLPEPCNGNFDSGSIYFWAEAI